MNTPTAAQAIKGDNSQAHPAVLLSLPCSAVLAALPLASVSLPRCRSARRSHQAHGNALGRAS